MEIKGNCSNAVKVLTYTLFVIESKKEELKCLTADLSSVEHRPRSSTSELIRNIGTVGPHNPIGDRTGHKRY